MKKYIFVICLFLPFLSGCFFDQAPPIQPSENVSPAPKESPVDHRRLSQGGKILVIPFTAGTQVVQDDELDHLSLSIVKGFSDLLTSKKSAFEIVSADQQQGADFIVQGHVTTKTAPGKFKRWVLMKHKIGLAVEGRVLERSTKHVLLSFSFRVSGAVKEGYDDLAYKIGNELGQFILDNSAQ